MIPLTLEELAATTRVSPSHLGRIERGERFPSARILRRLAKPLGFRESELLSLAGYLSPQPSTELGRHSAGQVDPHDDDPHRYEEHGQMPPYLGSKACIRDNVSDLNKKFFERVELLNKNLYT